MGLFNWQEIRGSRNALADLHSSSDNTVWQACLLAIVAGYADAVGFLVFNAFAGAMTGNTVLLGIALAGQQFAAAAQSASIIAAFLVGVAASALLRRCFRWRRSWASRRRPSSRRRWSCRSLRRRSWPSPWDCRTPP